MRPIDADDLVKAFEALDLMNGEHAESFTNMVGNRSMEIECAKDYIDNAKTIDARLVVHAHWIKSLFGDVSITCSNCDFHMCIPNSAIPKMLYCPNCGARMDEDERTLEYADQDTIMSAT